MINFASLFSQFRNNSGSAIMELVDDPNTNIDRLLDQDSFLNEYKSGNTKVMEYMKYNRFQELVNYVTVVGPANDKKKGYKYPLVASDILSSDNSNTIELFFPSQDIYVDQIKNIEKEVEVEVEVDQNENQQQAQKEQSQPKTIIEDKLEGQQQGKAQETKTSPEKPEEESKPQQNPNAMEQQIPEPKKSTKLVKKIETVQQIEKIKKQPLIAELFRYFEGEVNYTLAGYISKILVAFYNKKPLAVIQYLLDDTRFESVLNHVESRSVGQLIMKLLTHESNELLERRKQAYERLLARLSLNNQIYVMSNLSVCVCDIIQKVSTNIKSANPIQQFGKIFFTPSTITKVITNVMSQQENVSIYNAPVLLVYLTNAPLNIPQDKQIVEQFKNLLKTFLTSALEKLKVTRGIRSALGVGRIKIIEIISFILKSDILQFKNTVGQNKQLFPILFKLCKNYEMNNILHNQVLKMIDLALSDNNSAPSPYLQSLINENVLLNFIIQEAQEDKKIRSGGAQRKTRKGYIGHIITICQKLLEKAPNNQTLKDLTQNDEFKRVVEELVDKQTYEQRKNLAGYSLKKNNGQSIMFMKEDVIQAHFKFLAACPAPQFEPQKPAVNIQHPDFQQSHTVQNTQEVIQAIKEQEREQEALLNHEQIPSGAEVNPKFWINHLEYDVEELMNDL